jgi:hypothetical protein
MTECDHKFVGGQRCAKCGWAVPKRNFHSPEKLKQIRRRGGLKGSKAYAAGNKLAKVFAELDEEQEP